MKQGERYILTTGKPSVIRDALSFVFAGVNSEGDLAPGTLERIEEFTRVHGDRLILDLRTSREPSDNIVPRIRKLRVSRIGQVLVVTGESTSPELLHRLEELCRPHFFLKHFISSLSAFSHALF